MGLNDDKNIIDSDGEDQKWNHFDGEQWRSYSNIAAHAKRTNDGTKHDYYPSNSQRNFGVQLEERIRFGIREDYTI